MTDTTHEAPDLLPCPFCGGGITSIEGKGRTWRGVKGYSDPQWYQLNHFGKLSTTDDFPRCSVEFRCRTEAQAIKAWNTRSDDLVQAAVERGFWLGRKCGGSKAEIDAALATIREGGE